MKILFAAAEASPLAKVGGMADVVGTLPKVLRRKGFDVRVILPYYGVVNSRLTDPVELVWRGRCMYQDFDVFETRLPESDVPLYLVGHGVFMANRIYYGDDEDWRFTLFANACAEFAWNFWKPHLIHCHDWHTGMIPVWMHQTPDISTVFTIHNLAYQGPWRWRLEQITWVPWYFRGDTTMAAAITFADRVNTVSPTYAKQICTPAYGEGLDGLLSQLIPRGILNGIDEKFDPRIDPYLVKNFDADSLDLRIHNKLALQQEVGLQINKDAFLVGMVTRLVEQKGIDLVIQMIGHFLSFTNSQFVVVGAGDRYYESQLWQLAARFPGKMSTQILFSSPLSQRVYGGCDAFLMPSRFEPCGISQMIALKYGCVPIVRSTGGLVDTVQHHDPEAERGNGYCFDRYDPMDMYTAMISAYEGFRYPESWRKLQQRGMAMDFSWETAAERYLELYRSIPSLVGL